MVQYLSHFNLIWLGILASLCAGLATGVGSIPIFFTKNVSKKILDMLLGIAAGVMLAATSFSLIVPAIEKGGGGVKGSTITLIGILCGGFFIDAIDKYFPDTNLLTNAVDEINEEQAIDSLAITISRRLRKTWLFVLAITIHNFPEGLAVGVGFGDGDIANGLSLAIGIGLQNFPEGLAVALPLVRDGFSRKKSFLIALASGLVEPIGGLLGVSLVQVSKPILPFAMAFAAGAMLFVIAHEIIPETQSQEGHSKQATHAMLVGFVIMMFLDNTLG
ncbi:MULTISPECIES: ZIP family metal transporter [Clostridium]|jgi:ZIP family zinc transporter|uniref:Zinc transporter ZupT n=2 Tax=Clostridium TaxID=1485 RepID=A0A151APN8_9CLOT|nr:MULTISPECIES: ZIP family metal transporter [Clostridium]KYH29601.1 zinc transporter ZupT [Clostridium colicanis DSM 13634]MBE6043905.1 ZIP family metal transporter [Clostridium thermopalmarium]PRR72052.1 Zinc transporter ZupT [Clostridium thermopalmarium DSM 5974]PVZ23704.1 ZIP family zinc transporter [Clostridium thermopalmarium DSM 5974]